MNIAITGASGFIGSALTRALGQKGFSLRLIVHKKKPDLLDRDKFDIKTADVHNIDTLVQAFININIIYHIVGIIAETRQLTFEKTVAGGTRNVVEAAQKCGVKKIVYLSALGTSDKSQSKYHQAKWKSEEYIRNSGIDYVILRPSVVFGPDDEFLNMIAGMIKRLPLIPVIGDGNYELQPIYIDDLVKIMIACLDNEKAVNRMVEIGGPKAYAYKELVSILKRHLNKKKLIIYLPTLFIKAIATVMERVLKPAPITTDQLLMLNAGNTCDLSGFNELFDMALTDLETGIKKYMR
jgi:NADH dehydrogenase